MNKKKDPVLALAELSQKLEAAHTVLDTLLAGGKYDPKQHPWLHEQLGNMFAERYVLAEPSAYENNNEHVVTSLNPMRHTQRNNRNRLLEKLDDNERDQVHILGSQVRQRLSAGEQDAPAYAKAYIATKADMYAMREMVSILQEKVACAQAVQSHQTNDTTILEKPLYILNQILEEGKDRKSYYAPLLEHLDINEELASTLNIHEVPKLNTALSLVKNTLPNLKHLNTPERPKLTPSIKPGDTIFIHTTTLEKLLDYQKIFRERGVSVRMLSTLEKVAESPEEHSHSFEGNAQEKLRAAQKLVAQIPDDVFQTKFGLERSQVHVMVDDSGFMMNEPRLLEHIDLKDMEGIIDRQEWIDKKIPFPGVELGPFMNAANGVKNLMDRIHTALENIPNADTTMTDISCLAISPAPAYDPSVKDITLKDYRPQVMDFMMYANKDLTFKHVNDKDFKKLALDPRLVESKHYEVPIFDNSQNLTIQELEDKDPTWRSMHHVRALAARALMSELGLPTRDKAQGIAADYYAAYDAKHNEAENTRPFVISLDGLQHAPLQASLAQANVTHATNNNSQHIDKPSDFEKIVADASGFVLMPQSDNTDLAAKYERAFRFWSLVVARQTDPRDAEKPIVLYNPDKEWDKLLGEYKELHAQGAIKERPVDLIKTVTDPKHGIDEITNYLKKAREDRDTEVNYTNKEHEEGNARKNDDQRYSVAIFCSATSERESYQRDAYNLSYNLCKDGFGVVYGGGSRYMMGKIAEGAEAAERDGYDFSISGSNMDHLTMKEGEPPKILTNNPKGSYLRAQHIYQRMEYMINSSDAFVIAPGGAGTMQELCTLLMLKAKGSPSMADKPIILVNPSSGDNKGFYDAIIANMGDDAAKLGVTVVDSVQAAKTTIDAKRATKPDKPKGLEQAAQLAESRKGFVDRFEEEKAQKRAQSAVGKSA